MPEDAIDREEEDVKEEGDVGAKETTGDGSVVVARRQATADAIRGLMMYIIMLSFV